MTSAYVIHGEPTDAPAFVAFTYAGYLLHQGVNAAGLGSVGNVLYARDAASASPNSCSTGALAARTIAEAIRAVTDPACAFGNNHLFAIAEGDIYDVERCRICWTLLHARNGFLTHARHFVSLELSHLAGANDLLRSHPRMRLVAVRWGNLFVVAIQGILTDLSNFPKSVCNRQAPEMDLDYGSIGSVVIDTTDRVLWACEGNSCREAWREGGLQSRQGFTSARMLSSPDHALRPCCPRSGISRAPGRDDGRRSTDG